MGRAEPAAVPEAWWAGAPAALFTALDSSPAGLDPAGAAERLARVGANAVRDEAALSALGLLLRQVRNPMVLILAFGASVSLVVREWVDAAIVLAIIAGSVLLGFLQEHRAAVAVRELRQRLALTARVRRGGATVVVPASTVVPGDIVLLAAGSLVPGDGLVLEARDFLVSEASLTGESFPVEKQPGTVPAGAPLAARTNAVYLGTSVRSGTATVLVVATGRRTVLGAIAGRLGAAGPETEFAQGVRHFGYLLVRVMLVMIIFVMAANQWLGRPPLESLLFAMALAVGMSPELLPAIVSVTLARGARDMARQGVLVPQLEAIENLGSMDVLCTDKTGTLTQGAVALAATRDPGGGDDPRLLALAYLNSGFETGIDNPLDAAIVDAGRRAGLDLGGHAKVDEIPYDFTRRRLTIVVAPADEPGTHLMVTKGALANVLAICTTVAEGGIDLPLDAARRALLEARAEAAGRQGFRLLGLAVRSAPARERYSPADEAGLSFRGFLLFDDPVKPDAREAIGELAALGVRVKMITGDNRHVAAHVGAAIGLDPAALLTGEDIAGLRPEALAQRAWLTDLFVEVDPQQKERIVQALRATGHAVGYLGDGINDAPALKAADVGISVDTAVDVARASAAVVLLQPDLAVLRRGIEAGRRTFANTLKYIGITTSANFGNMVSMALATPLLPFLPLAAKQILLNNFLSDLPAAFIATDNVDPVRLQTAQRWRVGEVRRFMIVFGLLSTAFDLATFGLLLGVFHAGEAEFQTSWFVVSLLTELLVVLSLRTAGPAWRSRPGRLLLASTLGVCLLAAATPFLGPVSALVGFVPLPAPVAAAGLGIVLAYILATEAAKGWFYRRQGA